MRTERLKITSIINKILTTAAVTASAVCFLSSCDSDTVFHAYHPVDNKAWDKADGVCFDVATPRHEGGCNSYLVVRTDGSYPFKNLSLFVRSTQHDSVTVSRVDFDLTDTGKDGVRHNDYIMPIRMLNIGKEDTIKVRISHNMHPEKIGGITDVGIKIEKRRK